MTTSLVAIVAHYADLIKNGRTIGSVMESVHSEVKELADEVDLVMREEDAGSDGVFGEAVDVIASALDMIWLERPGVSVEALEAEVAAYLDMKCAKWARKVAAGAY